jgi:hypothetical protein
MSHVISMHRSDDPRQTAFSDLSKVIPYLRFEYSTLVVRANSHSGLILTTCPQPFYLSYSMFSLSSFFLQEALDERVSYNLKIKTVAL